jgi:ribosomal protein L13
LSKLKIYNGDKHPHDMQKPKAIDFAKLNKRNIVG